jgi:thioredoxin 1
MKQIQILTLMALFLSPVAHAQHGDAQQPSTETPAAPRPSGIRELPPKNFDKYLELAQGPVLVEFYYPECPHCKEIAPVIKDVAEKYSDKVRFVRLNVNAPGGGNIYNRLKVQGTPSFYLFKDNKLVMKDFEIPDEALMIALKKKDPKIERKGVEVYRATLEQRLSQLE